MIDYTLTFKQDVYYITNNEAESVYLTITDVDDCTEDKVLTELTLEPAIEYQLPLVNDGIYLVELDNIYAGIPPDPDPQHSSFVIKYYLNLEKSMIEDIFSVLCNCECGCSDCVDLSAESCELLLTARVKTDSFIRYSSPRYDSYVNTANEAFRCLSQPQLYCDIFEENVSGKNQYSEKLAKQMLALDYLGIYFQELQGLTEQEDIDYIDEKFQSSSVFCCISKLGINIKEIENLINEKMGALTINTGAYVNQPPTTGNNTLATANRTSITFNMAMFTTQTVPPYNDPEGTPAIAVRFDTLPGDGIIRLNGTPILAGEEIEESYITAGLLIYSPPDQDPADSDVFNFSVQDSDGLWSS